MLYACLWCTHVWMQVYMLRYKKSPPSLSIIIFYYPTKSADRLVVIRAQWCSYLCPPQSNLGITSPHKATVAFYMGAGIEPRSSRLCSKHPYPLSLSPATHYHFLRSVFWFPVSVKGALVLSSHKLVSPSRIPFPYAILALRKRQEHICAMHILSESLF